MGKVELKVYTFNYEPVDEKKKKGISLGIYARDFNEAKLLNKAFAEKYTTKYKQVEKGFFDYERTKASKKDKNFNLEGLKEEYKKLKIKFTK